jgi:hypothetical protein
MSNDWKIIEKRSGPSNRKGPAPAGCDEALYIVQHIDTGETDEVFGKRSFEVGEHISDGDFMPA